MIMASLVFSEGGVSSQAHPAPWCGASACQNLSDHALVCDVSHVHSFQSHLRCWVSSTLLACRSLGRTAVMCGSR